MIAILMTSMFAGATAAYAQSVPNLSEILAESAGSAKATPSAASNEAVPSVDTKRAENAEMLRVAQRRRETGELTDSAAAQELAHYKTVEAMLGQHEAVDRQIAELRTRQAELEAELRSLRAAGAEKRSSYSFIDFDRMRDELTAEEARADIVADGLAAAKEALEKAQRSLTKGEAKRQQALEAFEAGKEGPEAVALSTAFEQARQAASLAAETIALRAKEVARGEAAQEVQRLAVELRQEQVTRAAPRVVFAESDLQEQFSQIGKQEDAAKAALEVAQTKRTAADERLRDAQKSLDGGTGDRAALTEQIAVLRREQERWSDDVDLLTQQLQRLAQLRMAWNHRYAIASARKSAGEKPASNDIKAWQKETQAALDELLREWSARIQRMADLRNEIATVADKAEAAKDGPAAIVTSINEQRTHLDEMLRSQQASLMQIESTRRVYLKLKDELGENSLSPTKLAAGALKQVSDFWNTELFTVGEGNAIKYITVKRSVTGLVVLVIGWLLSRLLSRVFANRFLKRFRLGKDADATLRSMAYYALLLVVLLVALKTVRVPLTAFTIVGGALAIGFGFGSQTLIHNFIGGLIMLAERPIRLGERITFGSFDGVVEEVGFRSTKLRTLTDHLVTIPNSTLVNDSIENVARRRTIRRLMNLAVNYDTPRQKLAAAVQAIRDILNEKDIRERIHPIVGFEQFPPRVYFNDYNAASFNIQIVYWYAPPDWWDYMEHCERVNYRIMEEFERLGVEFAFPSKTMHLVSEPSTVANLRKLPSPGSPPSTDRRNVA
jgi:small-conductance mechanosensitive channel